MAHHTFLWHDYETFGVNPRRDRPSQFAAIRTDAELRPIGEPIMLYCQPAPDYLPDPGACLLTGITPQQCLAQGLPEREFAARIQAELSQPGTIGVGYNTIRFDDEVTRFMLWRNLMDPYTREWQNECGRWDLLDVVRLTHALRPEGIQWPQREGGRVSFRLEDLSRANGLLHEAAHDALSDVQATIALAQLIRQHQPRLFDFAFGLHNKRRVAQELGMPIARETAKPFLHVSGMLPAEHGHLGVMWPLAMHPTNSNQLLAWDLRHDPSELAMLDADTIRQRLFTRAADLPEGMTRLPVKGIHLNKSPMVVGKLNTLSDAMAAHWQIDRDVVHRHIDIAATLPDMSGIWPAVFAQPEAAPSDVDEALYEGFLDRADKQRLASLQPRSGPELLDRQFVFDDPRMEPLVFRYRARNFPDTLTPEEHAQWEQHRIARLIEGEGGARTVDQFLAEIDALAESEAAQTERGEQVLEALYEYAEAIVPEH